MVSTVKKGAPDVRDPSPPPFSLAIVHYSWYTYSIIKVKKGRRMEIGKEEEKRDEIERCDSCDENPRPL